MSMEGTGFSCFWAQPGDGLVDDYDLWHTREHMVERVRVPGVLAGRSYVSTDPTIPGKFMYHDLNCSADFESQAWKSAVAHASPWTTLYRQPGNFSSLRYAGYIAVSAGGGIGACIATSLIKVPKDEVTHPWIVGREYLPTLLDDRDIIGVHLGIDDGSMKNRGGTRFDHDVVPAGTDDGNTHCVLLLDGFNPRRLKAALSRIEKGIQDTFRLPTPPTWRNYELCYYITQADARRTTAYPRPVDSGK